MTELFGERWADEADDQDGFDDAELTEAAFVSCPYCGETIEMIVDPDHRAACRWARLLGFEEEGYMKSYSPDGRDALMFARVRDGRT